MAGRPLDKRITRRFAAALLLVTCCFATAFFRPGASATDAGAFPFDLGAFPFEEFGFGSSQQRGLNEIGELPHRNEICPVCGFLVEVPLVDSLMRDAADNKATRAWRMDAAYRDSDFCPYPSPGKVFWQADVVICPNCGYAAETTAFPAEVPTQAAEWVRANLQPALREAQAALLGWRRGEMTEDEVAAYFNRQSEIPDAVRLEHWLTCLDGMHAPLLQRARGCWESAWGFRRRLVEEPRSEVFMRYGAQLREGLSRVKRAREGLRGEIDAVREVLRSRRRQRGGGESPLPGGFDMTGRLYVSGLLVRRGFLAEAEGILEELHAECMERYLRPEQDPLWPETSARAARTHRLNELELLRADAEREVLMHLELLRGERSRLQAAVELIRGAMMGTEIDGRPKAALLYGYLMGEFLRRTGNLPLAAEWFTNILRLGGIEEPLRKLVAEQLELVAEEAGGDVNLLSALGEDGEVFSRLREIYGSGANGL